MANTIKLKRSSTAGATPTAGSLEYGELALNYTDGNLFFKTAANVVTLLASTKIANYSGNVTVGGSLSVTGNATVGNIGATNVVATSVTGTLTTAAQPNITSVGTLTSVSVTGNADVGNLNSTGNVNAQYYFGDGRYLTGIAPSVQEYLFSSTVSNVSPYYQAVYISNFNTAEPTANSVVTIGTTGTLLAEFLTNTNFPGITAISAGQIFCRIETQKAAGAKAYTVYFQLYKRSAGGTETLLLTGDLSTPQTVNTNVQQVLTMLNASTINLLATDRLAVKIYAYTATGTDSITTTWGDLTDTGFDLPTPPASSTQFVPYTNATSNVSLGSFGITGSFATATGNITAGNLITTGLLSVTGNASAGNISTTGKITATGNIAGSYFIGDGSYLTNLPSQQGNSITNGTSNVAITSPSANVTVGVNGSANTVVISPGSIFVNGIFASPKTITSNVQMAADSTAMVISPLTIGNGYSMSIPTSSTVYIWIPS